MRSSTRRNVRITVIVGVGIKVNGLVDELEIQASLWVIF